MILNIYRKLPKKDFTGDCCNLDVASLDYTSTHLFIASHTWDKLNIELDDTIADDVLKYVRNVCKEINVILPDVVTDHTVSLLCELYPDKAGRIRKYRMMKRDLMEAINE